MMKKIAVLCAALTCVLAAEGFLYADSNEFFVMIREVIKASGGNKNVEISAEGLDAKESIRQVFSQYQGEGLLFMLYPKFDDKAWADMKFRSNVDSRDLLVAPYGGKMVAKPVPKNTVPSAKTGLLNPRNPVKIVTFSNKLLLIQGIYPLRLLDSKGRELGSIKTSWRNASGSKTLEITLPEGAHDYYVELCDNGGMTREYCYILLNIEPDPVKPAEDKEVTARIERFDRQREQGQRRIEDYMSRHGITDIEQLTDEDALEMVRENARASGAGSAAEQVISQTDIISQFMKERGISNMDTLSEKDQEELRRRLVRNSSASWPAAYRAVVDKYMKQHKIATYEDLTDEDFNAISRQFRGSRQ